VQADLDEGEFLTGSLRIGGNAAVDVLLEVECVDETLDALSRRL